jgi:uncharacterized protein
MNARSLIALGLATLASALLILRHVDVSRLSTRAVPSRPLEVDDRAMLFSDAQRTYIAQYHAALRDTHDIDYRVLALNEGGDINRIAHRYFEDAGVGELSASGRGLLLVIDTELDRVRLEVSTSLEGTYTDAFVAYIQHRQLVPFFQTGRVADGIVATTELIVTRAQDAEAGMAFAPPMPARSMGGGAVATAGIDTVDDPAERYKQQTHEIDVAGSTPLQVVEAYHQAMATRDARPDLPIYSADTRRMLRNWVVTPAQMDNVVRAYRNCGADGVRIQADLAVVRYDVGQRQCAPYFLRREDGGWKLDLGAASSLIRFNHENQWRFQTSITHEYRFAFEDWRIDANGVPRAAD